ncbi:MAG: glycosyltransferase [Desulfobacteraceae bacterium]|jgi:glycosyltransferase involved in cell wall biosynthesis
MVTFKSSADNIEHTKLAALEQLLIDSPDRTQLLQAYFHQAVEADKLAQACRFLEQLQHGHQWNHSIRKLFIALCLQQKEYPAAMEAVETLMAFSTPDDALIDSALAIREHLGPCAIHGPSAMETSISLCMIVKNEQAFLGPCLNAIKPMVDELIVVDTGSEDRSIDIARVYGARVYAVQWQDDFSAARNVSLEKARGHWILILDADEVIASQDFAALRQMVQCDNKTPKAYSLQTRNYLNTANAMDWRPNDRCYPQQEAGMGWFPTDKVRLFPNLDGIRFDYPVHEMVDPKVKQAGISIRRCPVPVHHYGHLNETKNLQKAETYFRLGYAKLDQLGDDPAAIRELAVQAGQLGRWMEAVELWQRLLALCPGYHEAYANMAGAFWQLGEYDQGIDFSRKAIQVNPTVKEGHYNLAVNLFMKGQAEEAGAVLQRLLEKHAKYLPARFMSAAILSIIGDRQKSSKAFFGLKKEMSGQVLSIAVEDLFQKLKSSGRSDYADIIKETAGMS